MSIITLRAGIMACDKKISRNGSYAGDTKKIKKIGNLLVGCCGSATETGSFFLWAENFQLKSGVSTELPDLSPDTEAILYDTDTSLSYLIDRHGFVQITPGPSQGIALGSGAPEAHGAMAMGADAIRAAEIAVLLENDCGGEVIWIK